MDSAYSVNGVPIRLTAERWEHIVSNKPYMQSYYEQVLDTIERPTWIEQGYAGTLVAILTRGRRKYLHVVYRELSQKDGFIITAFIAQKANRRKRIWPKKP